MNNYEKQVNTLFKIPIVELNIKSLCNDGRKVPVNMNLDNLMQLNTYIPNSELKLNSNQIIFTYNPFKIHPITTRSVLDSIDNDEFNNLKNKYKKNAHYYFPRKFDLSKENLDPIEYKQKSILIFDNSLELDKIYYFQHNINYENENKSYFIKLTPKDFINYLKENNNIEIFQGTLEQKIRL